MDRNLAEVLSAFFAGEQPQVRPLGSGNINATYLVCSDEERVVLQRINADVFADPEVVVNNFVVICRFLQKKNAQAESPLSLAAPRATLDGQLCYRDAAGGVWRAQAYVESVEPLLTPGEGAVSVGRTLGLFHALLRDLPPSSIHDPLPGLHNLSAYLLAYDRCDPEAFAPDNQTLSFCRESIAKHRLQLLNLDRALKADGKGRCVVHGDPKIDNFIFHPPGIAAGLFDLDTVSAGNLFYDLGDCLRSACNPVGEDIDTGQSPSFDLDICADILGGYCSVASDMFAGGVRQIYDGLLVLCFELAVRFVSDYLQGNVYFTVRQKDQNLLRARAQLLLFQDILRRRQEIYARLDKTYKAVC